MPPNPDDQDPLLPRPTRERRQGAGRRTPQRWLREALGRPLALERRERQWHVTLVERRRSPEAQRFEALQLLREELDLRLSEIQSQAGRLALRHLIAVHELLSRKGWAGVESQSSRVLAKAVMQGQLLTARDCTERMKRFIEHLRRLQVAAEVREDRSKAGPGPAEQLLDEPTTLPDAHGLREPHGLPEMRELSESEWVGVVVPTEPAAR